MPREAAIVESIVRLAKSLGYWVKKIHGNTFQAGLPDLLCLKDGKAIWLEVKQPGKKPTPLQVKTMYDIRVKGGAECYVVTSREEANACLQPDQKSVRRAADDPFVDRCERRNVRTVRGSSR